MAWIDQYPYTNFHELNLDWILTKTRELVTEWNKYREQLDDIKKKQDAINSEFESLYNYIDAKLDNLNIKPIILDYLKTLYDSGAFSDILSSEVIENYNNFMITDTKSDDSVKFKTFIYNRETVIYKASFKPTRTVYSLPANGSLTSPATNRQTPLEYAVRNVGKTQIVFNGMLSGKALFNGVEYDNDPTGESYEGWYYIVWNDDNDIEVISRIDSEPSFDILRAYGNNALAIWSPLIVASKAFDWQRIIPDSYNKTYICEQRHPRTVLAVGLDGTWHVYTIRGRLPLSIGMNYDEMIDFLRKDGAVNAWNFDGGGSTMTVVGTFPVGGNNAPLTTDGRPRTSIVDIG